MSHARSTPSDLARAVLRQALVQNPLFLLSAALVLVGAWLLNPPAQDGTRNLDLLWRLFAAIQVYELSLLGAAALFARRGGLERDVRSLALVLAPFVLDTTLTTCALLDALLHFDGALPFVVAALVVGLSAVKIALAARLSGVRLGLPGVLTLLAGPALVTGFPVLAYMVGEGDRGLGSGPGSGIALAGGLGLAALVVAFDRGGSREGPGAAAVRRLAAVALPVATLHVGATVWSHSGDLLHVAGPLVIALGAALPRLAWPALAPRDLVTPLVLPLAGAAILGWSGHDGLGHLTAAQWGLMGVVLVHGRELLRTRATRFALAPLAVAELVKLSASGHAALVHPIGAFEPAVVGGLFAVALYRRAHEIWIASALGLAGALVHAAGFVGAPELDGTLATQAIGAGVLAWAHRGTLAGTTAARARLAGTLALVVPSYLVWLSSGRDAALPQALGVAAIAGLLALRLATGYRVYALPVILIPAFGARAVPRASAAAWGVVGLALAFVAVALGVVTTLAREKILAWLERSPQEA